METEDPIRVLVEGDVAARSAAARDLARMGSLQELELLLDMATGHKSSAVRLYAAAATSAILSRHRALPGHEPLDASVIERVITRVCGVDPSVNPPLLMALSTLPDPRVVPRLGRMLRDPRNAVRQGAIAALRMRVSSAVFFHDKAVRGAAREWLGDRRMPLDTIVELNRLIGDAGWYELVSELPRRSGVGDAQLEVGGEAHRRLKVRQDPSGWEGLWQSDGLDVLEVNEQVSVPEWCVIGDGVAASVRGTSPLTISPEGRVALWGAEWRMIWVTRTGLAAAAQALQCSDGRTFYLLTGPGLVAGVAHLQASLQGAPRRALLAAADSLVPPVDASGKAERDEPGVPLARALLTWRAGDLDRAMAELDLAAKDKKTKLSSAYWRARVLVDLGLVQEARESLASFLEKAPKKADERQDAQALWDKLNAQG